MLTLITMLVQKIESATMIGLMLLISWILYLILYFVLKPNRRKAQIKAAFICGGVATLVCDIILFFKFFDNFEYLNPGFSGIIYALILPGVMLLLVMIQSYINTSTYQREVRAKEKEQEKLRKKESHKKKFEPEPTEEPEPVPELEPASETE